MPPVPSPVNNRHSRSFDSVPNSRDGSLVQYLHSDSTMEVTGAIRLFILLVVVVVVVVNCVGVDGTPEVAASCDGSHDVAVAVYGGTAGGVVAAIAAARNLRNKNHQKPNLGGGASSLVLLINPSGSHLGGMVSSGLGWTDGTDSGGIAAEAFAKMGGYHFAPSTAERVFDELVKNESSTLSVASSCRIVAVEMGGRGATTIVAATTSAGGRVTAAAFVDSTYEGDLMAMAGVSFVVGREAAAEFNESAGGRLPVPPTWDCGCNWGFKNPVDGASCRNFDIVCTIPANVVLKPPMLAPHASPHARVWPALFGARACRVLTGACNAML